MNDPALYRQLDLVTEQRDHAQRCLTECKTALLNSQHLLNETIAHCRRALEHAHQQDVQSTTESLEKLIQQTQVSGETTEEIRKDAFLRGFGEGFIYKRLHNSKTSVAHDALQFYLANAPELWPSSKSHALIPSKPYALEPAERYRFDSETPQEMAFLGLKPDTEWVLATDYDDLRWSMAFLQEELAGYRQVMCDPQVKTIKPKHAKLTQKLITPRRPQKPGMLKVTYGASGKSSDLWVLFGSEIPACDRSLALHVFSGARMQFDYAKRLPAFERSFIEELVVRGYDLSTLRFSIEKNENNHRTNCSV